MVGESLGIIGRAHMLGTAPHRCRSLHAERLKLLLDLLGTQFDAEGRPVCTRYRVLLALAPARGMPSLERPGGRAPVLGRRGDDCAQQTVLADRKRTPYGVQEFQVRAL
jgi:hypothetical protein